MDLRKLGFRCVHETLYVHVFPTRNVMSSNYNITV